MPKATGVLVVDDNAEALAAISSDLRAAGYQVRTAKDGRAGWEQFRAHRPELVISDIRMPHESGIDLLRRIREVSDAPVILLTARADVSAAVSALREGATDFVRFPEEVTELLGRVRGLLPVRNVAEPDDAAAELLAGDTPAMRELRNRVRSLAILAVPVLISGEEGTGRLAAARAIHVLSGAVGPLVAVRGPGFELPIGRCAAALVGLDSWPRATQERWSEALRASDAERFARVYTIASPAFADRVDRGEVRRDLWVRTARFRVDVPPLRARVEEIPRLAREALVDISKALGRGSYGFTAGALDALRRRPWRGNIPELREVLEQAVAFAEGSKLGRDSIDRAVEAVIEAREDSLANRRAAKQSADRAQLVRLLGSCRGNVAEIARQLGLTRGAVTYRLRKHGLSR